ncbi:MAG: hypothetical protein H0V29_12515 [Thermoleophilaceae bacterium]|nr:hypothetical protein [Thermoleophilaceae bacterium]
MEIAASLLANGSPIFLGVVIVFLASVVYGLFTTGGSGINTRPYGKVHGGAPGARGPSEVSGKDSHQAYSRRGMR